MTISKEDLQVGIKNIIKSVEEVADELFEKAYPNIDNVNLKKGFRAMLFGMAGLQYERLLNKELEKEK